MMKKLFFILLLLCPLMVLTSCGGSSKNKAKEVLLINDIETSNAQCPIQLDYATTALSIKLERDVVVYSFEVDENFIDLETINQEQFKTKIKNNLVALYKSQDNFHVIMSLAKETDKSIRYNYKGSLSGKTVTIEFSNADLREMFSDE